MPRLKRLEVLIDPVGWDLMTYWADSTKHEVCGLGKLEVLDDGILHASSPIVFKQKTATDTLHCSYDQDALFEWMMEKGFMEKTMPYVNWFIWHSHAEASCFHSSEDIEMMQDYSARGYLGSLVINRKGEMAGKVSTLAGSEAVNTSTFVEVPSVWRIGGALDTQMREWADKQFKDNVTFYQRSAPTKWVSNDGWDTRFASSRNSGGSYGPYGGYGGVTDIDDSYRGTKLLTAKEAKALKKERGHGKKNGAWNPVFIKTSDGSVLFNQPNMVTIRSSKFTGTVKLTEPIRKEIIRILSPADLNRKEVGRCLSQ